MVVGEELIAKILEADFQAFNDCETGVNVEIRRMEISVVPVMGAYAGFAVVLFWNVVVVPCGK